MEQLNLLGEIKQGFDGKNICAFCGNSITDSATSDYLKKKRERCAECEIEFCSVVFSLTPEQIEVLRKAWVINVL